MIPQSYNYGLILDNGVIPQSYKHGLILDNGVIPQSYNYGLMLGNGVQCATYSMLCFQMLLICLPTLSLQNKLNEVVVIVFGIL